jgi:outer membrane protein insertion porin family
MVVHRTVKNRDYELLSPRRLAHLTSIATLCGLVTGVSLCVRAETSADTFMGTTQPPAISSFAVASLGPEPIQDFHVDGSQRIDTETVISYLAIAKGDPATPEKIDASLKALYATGLFSDVAIRADGATLNIKVEENPIIDRVTFEGNDAISKDDLEKEVQLKSRLVYTLPRVQRDVQRILDLYRRSGRFAALVEPKIIKLPQNRVDLVFEIAEGDRTGIRSVTFIGNANFSEDVLHAAISTRESAWWRFLSTSDYYDSDRLNYDKELLRKFYLREGYVDFRVLSAVAELTPDRADFFLTFTVEEGQRYKYGKVVIKSEIKGIDGESLRPHITTSQGNWYNSDQVEKTITALTTVLGDRQYAFATISPDINRHRETLTIDLTYTIKQSDRVYIGRIDIGGNDRTVDKVIRRQIKVAEGDPFSATALHKSEQNLKDLGYFETVKVTPMDGAQPDRANVKVEVKEKSTGSVAVGAGFSSTDGPLGDFTLSEHNFLGRGQDVRFGATLSGRTQQIDTSFTEPYFLGRDLSAGGDIYYTQTDNQDLSSYSSISRGVNLRVGYPLSPLLRQRINYSFHNDTIRGVPTNASVYVAEQQGGTTTSSFGQSLVYDTRDSKLTPTLGFITSLDTDIAGLGGSRKWGRVKVSGTQYYPIDEDWIISGLIEAAGIWSFNGSTRINERFFLGDTRFRGFQYAGIGPRDLTSANQDALGSTRYVRTTLNLTMPLPVPEEFGLVGHLFSDAGFIGNSDTSPIAGSPFANEESLRLSAGVGVTWASPFGPVRLDIAQPLIYKSYDKKQTIHFNFGARF